MGFDKQLITINEKKLIDHIIEKISIYFDQIIITTNTPEIYTNLNVTVIVDKISVDSPLAGIYSGLLIAKSKYSYVIACDMPNVNVEYIEYLKNKIECNSNNPDAVITKQGIHIEPFNGFYHKALSIDIEKFLNNSGRKIKRLLDIKNVLYIEEKLARKYSPDWDMFANLNTQEEYYKYLNKEKL